MWATICPQRSCSAWLLGNPTRSSHAVNQAFSDPANPVSPSAFRAQAAKIRPIKLTNESSLDDPYLIDLINQAITHAPKSDIPPSGKIEIIVMNGPKRRPAK